MMLSIMVSSPAGLAGMDTKIEFCPTPKMLLLQHVSVRGLTEAHLTELETKLRAASSKKKRRDLFKDFIRAGHTGGAAKQTRHRPSSSAQQHTIGGGDAAVLDASQLFGGK